MKHKIFLLGLLMLSLVFSLVFTSWESVKAQAKSNMITKDIEVDKSLYIPFGRGGVYFAKSAYTGTVILTRTAPSDTRKLTFTQPWLDVKLYDTKEKIITTVKGNTYVIFNLTADDRTAWDNGMLSIYQYNPDKKIWQECKTYFIAGGAYSAYGKVVYRITNTYGTYGLAIKK